jgi:hypothetical protein
MVNKTRSQRDWIRTPSRGWVQKLDNLLNQNTHIKVSFIKAHTNNNDTISRGNEVADKLAKLGTKKPIDSAITLDFNGVYLSLENQILVSGIKKDLKKISKHIGGKIWLALNHQGNILREFRSHYAQIYKNLIPMILERRSDKVWSFFILATLRWFTTPRNSGSYMKCKLCLDQKDDNLEHFFSCEKLKSLHLRSEEKLFQCLRNLDIKLPYLPDPVQWSTTKILQDPLTKDFSTKRPISMRYLSYLASNYILNGYDSPTREKFLAYVDKLLLECNL